LAQELTPQDRVVVIDKIQRLPVLLNEVHRLIEERGVLFLMTGSSARKLRRGGINLPGAGFIKILPFRRWCVYGGGS
jgi:hypothetical protein